jgi:hypothetical protein
MTEKYSETGKRAIDLKADEPQRIGPHPLIEP